MANTEITTKLVDTLIKLVNENMLSVAGEELAQEALSEFNQFYPSPLSEHKEQEIDIDTIAEEWGNLDDYEIHFVDYFKQQGYKITKA